MPKGLQSQFAPESSFKLGDWLVEPNLNTISRDNETSHLEVKVMELLVFLAHRGSRLITRREIIDGVWGTEFICDNTLTHAISELRAALGDNARDPSFIQTIHRRGYRVLVPVTSIEGRELPDPGRPSRYRIVTGARSIRLKEGVNLIGRALEATVHVDSVWVSREHARITVRGGAATIEDLDSRNGTFVNGSRLTRKTPLAQGDTIYLGRLTDVLRFESGGPHRIPTEPLDEQTPIAPHLKA